MKLTSLAWLLSFTLASAAPRGSTTVAAALKSEGPWKQYPTRTLEDLPAAATAKPDSGLSQYGGLLARKVKATGFFYPAKLDGRWWLVDPEGGLFLHKGVASVSMLRTPGAEAALSEKLGNATNWAPRTTALLRQYGFNGLGAWSDT